MEIENTPPTINQSHCSLISVVNSVNFKTVKLAEFHSLSQLSRQFTDNHNYIMLKGIHTKHTKTTKATVVRLDNLMSSKRSQILIFSFRCSKNSPCKDHFVESLSN